jgi:hypothetical protein
MHLPFVTAYMQDGGDPDVAVSPRDIAYTQDLPSLAHASSSQHAGGAGSSTNGSQLPTPAPPRVLATTDLRCSGVAWCDDDLALGEGGGRERGAGGREGAELGHLCTVLVGRVLLWGKLSKKL